MSLALEFAAEFGEVVDLAVVGDPHRAVFIAHWHVPNRRQIEDRESPAS